MEPVLERSVLTEEEMKRLYVVLEMLNGFTREEALKNYDCEHGRCTCP